MSFWLSTLADIAWLAVLLLLARALWYGNRLIIVLTEWVEGMTVRQDVQQLIGDDDDDDDGEAWKRQ